MGRMTWEEAPKWAKELGKHHSEALRNAVIAPYFLFVGYLIFIALTEGASHFGMDLMFH